MNLEHLTAFYTAVTQNSISKAAKKLHISQPALSMQIQALERELNSELLIRSTKGVQLTESGEVLFDYAKTILSLKENIKRDIENINKNTQLLLGACNSIGEYALPCSIFLFKRNNPEIDIRLEISNTPGIIGKLLDHTIRIGIIQGKPQNESLEYFEIMRDRVILIAQPELWENLYGSDVTSITIDELKILPLILKEKESGTCNSIENLFAKLGISEKDLNVIFTANTPEAVKSGVLAGQGFSFMPEYTVKKELKSGLLREISIENLKPVSHYYACYLKNTKLRPHENLFLDFLKSNKRGFC